MQRSLIYGPFVALLASALASPAAPSPEREQLPPGVTPLHYDLSLVPDAANLKFRGQVRITIDVQSPSPAIVLNAADLALDKATLDTETTAASISLDPKLQRATISFAHPVAAGRHTLAIDYHGAIRRAADGFFAMDYDGPAGKSRTLATDFEPANERFLMPSWDEPALKATFTISAEIPADLTAVSNMPVASTESLADGHKRIHFATTPKMSTYLLFLAIGDFERIHTVVDGTDVGVVNRRGDTEKGRFALAEAARVLHFYNDYFGTPYPLPKLDLVAAPGETGGAMENWGAIFYAQKTLLFDPQSSTEGERQLVFMVVAHEMAHQWFGDLVTMAWWDDLWLNEGFADWMLTKAEAELHPDWQVQLKSVSNAESGKSADAKPSTHPIVRPVWTVSQAEEAFDSITYSKGAAVIAMLEAYVGPDAFREGVRSYIKAHAYGNTVDADFWREVQTASGKPVLSVEADFTRQPGLPMLKVAAERTGATTSKLLLTPGRFAEDPATIAAAPAQSWHIPIAVSAGGAPATHLLSGSDPTTLSVEGAGPIIVNAGQSTYVRVLYSPSMIDVLSSQFARVHPADQLGILCDTWALGQSGIAPVSTYLDLARALPANADPVVWGQIVDSLVSLERLYRDTPGYAAFTAFARDLLNPLAARLGWDAPPGENSNTIILRENVVDALSRFGDQRILAEARRRFDLAQQNVTPEVRRMATSIVARTADAAMLDRLIALLRSTHDPLEKQNIMLALAGIADTAGAQRVLELALGSDAYAGAVVSTLGRVAREHPDLAWDFALQHVDKPGFPMSSEASLRLVPRIASWSSSPKRAAELRAYADAHFPVSARQNVEEAIAYITLDAKIKSERIPEIDRWLAK
ncbi:MAG: M1 family aminopeptidase [Bryobacteraceae bacterium]